MKRTKLAIPIILSVVLSTACSSEIEVNSLSFDKHILEEFRGFCPTVVDVSGDGQHLLRRQKVLGTFEAERLSMVDIKTGRVLRIHDGANTFFRLRLSPDGDRVSYFIPDRRSHLRRLFLWDWRRDQCREIEIPKSYAQPDVQWAPDGRRIAFLNTPPGIVVVDTVTGGIVINTEEARGFAWSKDSTKVAIVSTREPIVNIMDASTGVVSRRLEVGNGIHLREVSWAPAQALLVRTYSPGSNIHSLSELNPNSGAIASLYSTGDEISEARWISAEGRLMCGRRFEAEQNLLVWLNKQEQPRVLRMEGALSIQKVSSLDDTVYLRNVSPAQFGLWQLNVTNMSTERVAWSHADSAVTSAEPVMIHTKDHDHPIPIWLSKGKDDNQDEACAVIMLSGGNNVYIPPERWAETQVYLSHDVHVVHVAKGKEDAAGDLITVARYLRATLGVDSSRIAVVCASSPTEIAIEAAQRSPKDFGVLALTGVSEGKLLNDGNFASLGRLRVLAFHGERDPGIAPAAAKRILERSLGKKSLERPRGLWSVFPDEGHSLQADENRAAVIATVLAALGKLHAEK